MAECTPGRWPGWALVAVAVGGAAMATEPPPDPALLEFIGEWSDDDGGTLDPAALDLALAGPRSVATAPREVDDDDEGD